jgi:hypothetical protein
MQRRQKIIAPNHETRTKTRTSEQFFTKNDQFCTNNLLILYEIYMYVWTEAGPQKPPRVHSGFAMDLQV